MCRHLCVCVSIYVFERVCVSVSVCVCESVCVSVCVCVREREQTGEEKEEEQQCYSTLVMYLQVECTADGVYTYHFCSFPKTHHHLESPIEDHRNCERKTMTAYTYSTHIHIHMYIPTYYIT